jgi:antitoxin (DNA-binding transcriptional repressor) of toxin-antitoxin stability system
MTRTISQDELRDASVAVLREVEAGQILVVTRNGTAIAELRPVRAHLYVYVPRDVLAEAAAKAARIDAGRFRTDLDAVVDELIDD